MKISPVTLSKVPGACHKVSFPSSEKQKDLARILEQELKDLGLSHVEMDQWGYVFGTIPSNSSNTSLPTICFCSHMDTAPDCSGTNVKPIVHRNYTGEPITLPDDPSQIITVDRHSYLKEKIGDIKFNAVINSVDYKKLEDCKRKV